MNSESYVVWVSPLKEREGVASGRRGGAVVSAVAGLVSLN